MPKSMARGWNPKLPGRTGFRRYRGGYPERVLAHMEHHVGEAWREAGGIMREIPSEPGAGKQSYAFRAPVARRVQTEPFCDGASA
jgi:hypothetical protein